MTEEWEECSERWWRREERKAEREKKKEMKRNKQASRSRTQLRQRRRRKISPEQQQGGEGQSSVGSDPEGRCVCFGAGLGRGGQCITALAFSPSGTHSPDGWSVWSVWSPGAIFFISSPVACFWFSSWTPIYRYGHTQWRMSSQLAVNSPVLWRRLIDIPSPNSGCRTGGGGRQVKNHQSPAAKSPLQQIPEGRGRGRVRGSVSSVCGVRDASTGAVSRQAPPLGGRFSDKCRGKEIQKTTMRTALAL